MAAMQTLEQLSEAEALELRDAYELMTREDARSGVFDCDDGLAVMAWPEEADLGEDADDDEDFEDEDDEELDIELDDDDFDELDDELDDLDDDEDDEFFDEDEDEDDDLNEVVDEP